MGADRAFDYDASKFLVVSLDLPLIGSVIEASPERPYLCVAVEIDVAALGELMLDRPEAPAPRPGTPPAIGVSTIEPGLLDAVARLLRLLDSPADARVLAPLAEREILYRLLTGEQAEMMRHIAGADTRLSRISRAIAWLKDHYAGPCSVEALAAEAGMSASTFHEHFKATTAMSPLQYRTQLRLQEARRLMVADSLDAASAGFRVGYDSPSQFSRDYRRTFGAPPARDVARLRDSGLLAMAA
ncbi:AraC family transcriptional regulator N-terminal domain-containing protein [Sphingoaurantiacus capsulatus]|uniref:AraC family transcriptional regulator N-terminal domain-containing protein n=1 Tax=Sphingoaurantiacus capsulatus TaxID=1771310 RepID=A0ABV7X7E8_9SPHN